MKWDKVSLGILGLGEEIERQNKYFLPQLLIKIFSQTIHQNDIYNLWKPKPLLSGICASLSFFKTYLAKHSWCNQLQMFFATWRQLFKNAIQLCIMLFGNQILIGDYNSKQLLELDQIFINLINICAQPWTNWLNLLRLSYGTWIEHHDCRGSSVYRGLAGSGPVGENQIVSSYYLQIFI